MSWNIILFSMLYHYSFLCDIIIFSVSRYYSFLCVVELFFLCDIILFSVSQYYEGPAKGFVTGFGLLQCYVLSNIFWLQTFKVFPLYWNTFL